MNDKEVTEKHMLIEDMRLFRYFHAWVMDFYHPSDRYSRSMQRVGKS